MTAIELGRDCPALVGWRSLTASSVALCVSSDLGSPSEEVSQQESRAEQQYGESPNETAVAVSGQRGGEG